MILEFKKVKENNTSVPVQDKTNGEWAVEGFVLINSENYTIKECPDRKGLCLLVCDFNNNFSNNHLFVLVDYNSIRKLFSPTKCY